MRGVNASREELMRAQTSNLVGAHKASIRGEGLTVAPHVGRAQFLDNGQGTNLTREDPSLSWCSNEGGYQCEQYKPEEYQYEITEYKSIYDT